MNRLLLGALLVCCPAVVPAFAHSWYPLGWSGPIAGGGTTQNHPENLCQSYSAYSCIVAGTQTFGTPLKKWRIDVWNSGGLNATYYTNDRDDRTPGWIVVIGATGLSWGFTPIPGSYDGIVCQMFTPGQAGGIASLSWGTGRYYYQAVFNGSFGGGPCVAP